MPGFGEIKKRGQWKKKLLADTGTGDSDIEGTTTAHLGARRNRAFERGEITRYPFFLPIIENSRTIKKRGKRKNVDDVSSVSSRRPSSTYYYAPTKSFYLVTRYRRTRSLNRHPSTPDTYRSIRWSTRNFGDAISGVQMQ